MRLTPEQLRELAIDAFTVTNFARRMGMKKDAQIDELVRTFEVTLGYRDPIPSTGATS
ncbi:hypothetical protein [Mesorhizobium sp. M2D.F.Ca.ET.232.01.1.1]|uniref:hypothetical protein n=1 Tax=Mesorhizobium sp. M2D.F.Ca.ET.232.01.1.1 TaxID=2496670 RepID=UPI0016759ABF|nr:hypothetical protein [Mesorhizobium sp. M2D.F.Ca.ET.232.01.1.1]